MLRDTLLQKYIVENENFRIVFRASAEFDIQSVRVWDCEQGEGGTLVSRRKSMFVVNGIFFFPRESEDWIFVNDEQFSSAFWYACRKTDDSVLLDLLPLPKELIHIIIQCDPDWRISESQILVKRNFIDFHAVIDGLTIAEHINRALIDCFQPEFHATRLFGNGTSEILRLTNVEWTCDNLHARKLEELALSSGPPPRDFQPNPWWAYQNTNRTDPSTTVFALAIVLYFDNCAFELSKIRNHQISGNVSVYCANWGHLIRKHGIMISRGEQFIQVGYVVKRYGYGWA